MQKDTNATNTEATNTEAISEVRKSVPPNNVPTDDALAYSLLIAEATQLKTQATTIYEESVQLQQQVTVLNTQASLLNTQASLLNTQGRSLDQQAGEMLLAAEIYRASRQQPKPDLEAAERFLKSLFRDVLSIVTDGRMRLCETTDDLPPTLAACCGPLALTMTGGLLELRQCTHALALELGFTSERWQDLITASHEAGMNAVVHAGGGVGRVNSDGQATIQVWVEDAGHGIAVERLPRATLERGYSTAGTFGYGMKMMLQSIDRIWLLTRPAGTTIVLEQDCAAPEPAWL